jgi:hypothetical protein
MLSLELVKQYITSLIRGLQSFQEICPYFSSFSLEIDHLTPEMLFKPVILEVEPHQKVMFEIYGCPSLMNFMRLKFLFLTGLKSILIRKFLLI